MVLKKINGEWIVTSGFPGSNNSKVIKRIFEKGLPKIEADKYNTFLEFKMEVEKKMRALNISKKEFKMLMKKGASLEMNLNTELQLQTMQSLDEMLTSIVFKDEEAEETSSSEEEYEETSSTDRKYQAFDIITKVEKYFIPRKLENALQMSIEVTKKMANNEMSLINVCAEAMKVAKYLKELDKEEQKTLITAYAGTVYRKQGEEIKRFLRESANVDNINLANTIMNKARRDGNRVTKKGPPQKTTGEKRTREIKHLCANCLRPNHEAGICRIPKDDIKIKEQYKAKLLKNAKDGKIKMEEFKEIIGDFKKVKRNEYVLLNEVNDETREEDEGETSEIDIDRYLAW